VLSFVSSFLGWVRYISGISKEYGLHSWSHHLFIHETEEVKKQRRMKSRREQQISISFSNI
jgi:hypothetical protein